MDNKKMCLSVGRMQAFISFYSRAPWFQQSRIPNVFSTSATYLKRKQNEVFSTHFSSRTLPKDFAKIRSGLLNVVTLEQNNLKVLQPKHRERATNKI